MSQKYRQTKSSGFSWGSQCSQYSDRVKSEGSVTIEYRIAKDFKGTGRRLTKVLSRHLPEGTHEALNQNSKCPCRLANRALDIWEYDMMTECKKCEKNDLNFTESLVSNLLPMKGHI
jgi:hypothetical protein